MIDFLARKKELMEKIFEITLEQSTLLSPENLEELLAAIERKQELINDINRINAAALPLEREFLSLGGIPSGDGAPKDMQAYRAVDEKKDAIDTLQKQMVLLVKETRKLEKENLNRISIEFRQLKKDIERIHKKRGSLRAYQRLTTQSDGYFIDKKK